MYYNLLIRYTFSNFLYSSSLKVINIQQLTAHIICFKKNVFPGRILIPQMPQHKITLYLFILFIFVCNFLNLFSLRKQVLCWDIRKERISPANEYIGTYNKKNAIHKLY